LNYEILSITLGTAAFFIIIVLFSLYKISNGMKKFLNDNLNEVLIASAEYIGENIETLDKTVLDRTQALQQENELLRSEIIEKLDAITMSSNIENVLQNFKSDIENTLDQLLSKINEIKIYGPISSENPPESFNPDLNTIKDEIKNLVAAIENVNNNFKAQSDIIKKSASYIGQKINTLDKNVLDKIDELKQEFQKLDKISASPNTAANSENVITNNADVSGQINFEELKNILQQIQEDTKNILDNLTATTTSGGTSVTEIPDFSNIKNSLDTQNDLIRRAAGHIGRKIESLRQTVSDKTDAVAQKFENISINQNTNGNLPANMTPSEIPGLGEIRNAVNAQNDLLTDINANIQSASEKIESLKQTVADKSENIIASMPQNSAGTEINIDWDNLKNILQDTLPSAIANEILSNSAIQNFENNLNEFNTALHNAATNFNAKIPADLVGTIQSVLLNGANDIRSELNRIRNLLQGFTKDTLSVADRTYIEEVFRAMSNELAAIIKKILEERS